MPASATLPAGTADASAPPASTPNQTQIAVAQAFRFPRHGDEEAALVIYEFSDYRCPYCRQFWEQTLPELRKEYLVPGGNVAFEFVDFPIEDHGIPAVLSAEAAHCAGEQGLYWDMHDQIFGHFAEMNDLPLEEETPSIDFLVGLGESIGADSDALRQCLETQRYRPTVATVFRDARDAEVGVTPTFLVGSELLLGFLPWEDFRPVVERQLALKLGTPWPTPTPRPTLTPTPSD
jgi:protein-disulfide isomerase